MRQLEHHDIHFDKKRFPITLVLDRIEKLDNIAMISRLCEAFGISKIICLDISPIEISQKLIKKSRHTLDKLELTYSSTVDYLSTYQKTYKLALDITTHSKSINEFVWVDKELHLIIGSERFGISQSLLDHSHDSYHITMYGQNTSLNVATATSIALYAITSEMIKSL